MTLVFHTRSQKASGFKVDEASSEFKQTLASYLEVYRREQIKDQSEI